MTKKMSFRKRFNIFFLLQNTFSIIIIIHNGVKGHHLDNNATFKKLKYVYSRCAFDCNQLDL